MGGAGRLGRSPTEGNDYHSSILAWKIPRTEEPGGLQSIGRKESDTTERLTFSPFPGGAKEHKLEA